MRGSKYLEFLEFQGLFEGWPGVRGERAALSGQEGRRIFEWQNCSVSFLSILGKGPAKSNLLDDAKYTKKKSEFNFNCRIGINVDIYSKEWNFAAAYIDMNARGVVCPFG